MDSRTTCHHPTLSFDSSHAAPAARSARAALFPEPLRSLCVAAWPGRSSSGRNYGFWCFGGYRRRQPAAARPPFRPAEPDGIPDSQGVGGGSVASRRFRRSRGKFDAGAGAASPHAAAHAGQPRFRLAAGRTSAPAHRGACERPDRSFRAGKAGRPLAGLRDAAADHDHCRNARRAGRDRAAAARLVASHGRDVHAWPHARDRGERRPRRAEFSDFLRGYVAERARTRR